MAAGTAAAFETAFDGLQHGGYLMRDQVFLRAAVRLQNVCSLRLHVTGRWPFAERGAGLLILTGNPKGEVGAKSMGPRLTAS